MVVDENSVIFVVFEFVVFGIMSVVLIVFFLPTSPAIEEGSGDGFPFKERVARGGFLIFEVSNTSEDGRDSD